MPGEQRLSPHLGVSTLKYSEAPTLSPPVSDAARHTMQANRSRDTGPERAVRALLHRAGLRYRVDVQLPFDRRRRADIVFSRVGLYVFIDGCFWHGCAAHFVVPKTRTDFWLDKVRGNSARDRDTDDQLSELGYTSLRIWEHVDPDDAAQLVMSTYVGLLSKCGPCPSDLAQLNEPRRN